MNATCDTHPKVDALTTCSRCGRPFCDPCLPALVEGLCACAGCANAERAHTGRPWGFAIVVLIACAMGSFAFARAEIHATGEPSWVLYGMAGVLALAFSGFVVSRKRVGLRVEPRESGTVPEDAAGSDGARGMRGGPYRGMSRPVFVRRLPPVSGRLTAAALLLSFVFCALALPFAMHLPRWLEAEIVLGAGWAVWTGVLAAILYRGQRVADDHRFDPSFWFGKKSGGGGTSTSAAQGKNKGGKGKKSSGGGGGGSSFNGIGSIGDIGSADEGCLVLLGAILLAGAAILTAWLLVELVIPALFTLAYLLMIRALKVATNDDTGCEGDPARSLGRGAFYASIFVGPLLALTAIVHVIAAHTAHGALHGLQ